MMHMGGLHSFVRLAWKHAEAAPFTDGWHIGRISSHLERVSAGGCPKTIINLPPGSTKSLLIQVFWPIWDAISHPGRKWIFIGYEKGLADLSARKRRQLIQSDWFRNTYGDHVSLPATTVLDEMVTNQGHVFYSTSTNARLTGIHGNLVYDDPQSANDIESPAALESTAAWCRRVSATRLADQVSGFRLLCQQRLHTSDLTAQLLAEDSGWEHLWYAAELDPEFKHPADPRTEPGQLLWPVRAPASVVARLRKELREDASGQLDQNPIVKAGIHVRPEWIRYTDDIPTQFDRTVLVCDPSFGSTKPSADPCGIQIWGRRGPDFYLLESIMDRMDMPAMLNTLRMVSAKWNPTLKIVEAKAAGTPLLDLLKMESPGWQGVDPRGSKQERFSVVVPLIQAGNVFLPNRVKCPWVDAVVQQWTQWPRCSHDEAIDLAGYALGALNDRSGDLETAMANIRALQGNGPIGAMGLEWLGGFGN